MGKERGRRVVVVFVLSSKCIDITQSAVPDSTIPRGANVKFDAGKMATVWDEVAGSRGRGGGVEGKFTCPPKWMLQRILSKANGRLILGFIPKSSCEL